MIRSCFRLPASIGIALFVMVLAGCQSMNPAPTTAPSAMVPTTAPAAVIAGKTTFINVNAGQGPPVLVAYTEAGKAPCPECEAVAAKYFSTGVLDEHVCKTCGAPINVGQGEIIQPK
jgi:hypothetical protein